MRRIRDRVGGLDVHRDSVTACARLVELGEVIEELERFSTTRAGVTRLGSWLLDRQVTTVAMEATGVYWKPIYYGLEGLFEELWLCNAAHVRNVPGRKTDLADAAWLADVVAHGMVRPSFVPPPPIRALRELTRYHRTQVDARAQEVQWLEKVLQDAGVKLTSVASTVWSVGPGDGRSADRRRARPGGAGRPGQGSDARQDRRAGRSAGVELGRASHRRRHPDHRPRRSPRSPNWAPPSERAWIASRR
jgi:Transposase